jgi:hypothetical protein
MPKTHRARAQRLRVRNHQQATKMIGQMWSFDRRWAALLLLLHKTKKKTSELVCQKTL